MLACVMLSTVSLLYLTKSLTRAAQYLSGSFLVLGFEIYLFDNREFATYVTSYQFYHNIALWFTNEFLTILSACTLLSISAFRYWKYRTM